MAFQERLQEVEDALAIFEKRDAEHDAVIKETCKTFKGFLSENKKLGGTFKNPKESKKPVKSKKNYMGKTQ